MLSFGIKHRTALEPQELDLPQSKIAQRLCWLCTPSVLSVCIDATFVVTLRSATCPVWRDCRRRAYQSVLVNDLPGRPDTIPSNWFGYIQ